MSEMSYKEKRKWYYVMTIICLIICFLCAIINYVSFAVYFGALAVMFGTDINKMDIFMKMDNE